MRDATLAALAVFPLGNAEGPGVPARMTLAGLATGRSSMRIDYLLLLVLAEAVAPSLAR